MPNPTASVRGATQSSGRCTAYRKVLLQLARGQVDPRAISASTGLPVDHVVRNLLRASVATQGCLTPATFQAIRAARALPPDIRRRARSVLRTGLESEEIEMLEFAIAGAVRGKSAAKLLDLSYQEVRNIRSGIVRKTGLPRFACAVGILLDDQATT